MLESRMRGIRGAVGSVQQESQLQQPGTIGFLQATFVRDEYRIGTKQLRSFKRLLGLL
ncbi:hypothetical protein D3C86_1800900 [compost metagenome]